MQGSQGIAPAPWQAEYITRALRVDDFAEALVCQGGLGPVPTAVEKEFHAALPSLFFVICALWNAAVIQCVHYSGRSIKSASR